MDTCCMNKDHTEVAAENKQIGKRTKGKSKWKASQLKSVVRHSCTSAENTISSTIPHHPKNNAVKVSVRNGP